MPAVSLPVSAVFLDAAGTLIHLGEPVGESYGRLARRHGIQVEGAALERAFRAQWKLLPSPLHPEGAPPADDDRAWWRELVARTFEAATGAPLSSPTLDALFADLYDHFAQPEAWAVYADVVPGLEKLRVLARLSVLSNFDRRLLRIMEGHGLLPYFDRVLLSSEVGASKPHERMFRAAVEAAGVPASACLHIGDEARNDHEGALAAGLQAALVDRPGVTLETIADALAAGMPPG